MTAPGSRLYAFDLLRLFAALMVVLAHWGFVFPAWYIVFDLRDQIPNAHYGLLGVELFFLISGFVILQSAENKTVLGFLKARALRLYPTFWICCTLTALFTASFTGYLANLTMIPQAFGMVFMDSVYWTLSIELGFYGVVALVIACGWLRHVEALLWLALALTLLPAAEMPLLIQFGAFFVGGAACCLLSRRSTSSLLTLFGLSWLSGMHQAIVHMTWQLAQFHQPFDTNVVAGLITVAYGLVLAFARGWIKVRPSKFVLAMGGITYPLYLLHNEIGKLLMAIIPGQHGLVVCGLLVFVVTLAYLVYAVELWICAKRASAMAPRRVGAATTGVVGG